MDVFNGKLKKGVITETWKRCIRWLLSCGGEEEERSAGKQRVAPEGCFTVYVGPKKQRFVIKTEYVNHPLFQMLLEEAKSEYGYNSGGPLTLPCDVDHFVKVLVEMDGSDDSYRLLSPSLFGSRP
jgi:SAUR family protein